MLLAAMRRNLLGWADHSPPVPFEWEQYLATRRQRDAMFILTVRWDVRAIWSVLTPTARFYVLCLLLAAVATTYFLGQSIFRMRRLLNGVTSIDAAIAGRCATEVKGRSEKFRQLHLLLFFLFGMILANEMFALVRAIEQSSMSLSASEDRHLRANYGARLFRFWSASVSAHSSMDRGNAVQSFLATPASFRKGS
jgi:hypothetical protein